MKSDDKPPWDPSPGPLEKALRVKVPGDWPAVAAAENTACAAAREAIKVTKERRGI